MKLKFITEKTEFTIICNKHTIESLISKFCVTFLQSSITPVEELKNLLSLLSQKIL